jgi:tetratricopeptide (TPR) repeat protein
MVSQSVRSLTALGCALLSSCNAATPKSISQEGPPSAISNSSALPSKAESASTADLHPERRPTPAGAIAKLEAESQERERIGDFRGAIEKQKAVLEIDPDAVVSMNTIAGLHGKLGEFEEELRWTAKALARNPRYVEALINRGNALGSLTRFDEADAAFSSALTLDPSCREAHNGRGVTAELRGRDDLAVRHFERAVALDKDYEDAWFNLAAARARLGDLNRAVDAVKEVLRINPDAEDAKKMLAHLIIDIANRKASPGKPAEVGAP